MFFELIKYILYWFIDNDNRFRKEIKVNLSFLLFFTLASLMLGVCAYNVHSKPSDSLEGVKFVNFKVKAIPEDVLEGNKWKFFKGDKKPEFKWNHRSFEDSKWLIGESGFGYGNSKSKTKLHDMKGKYDSIYVRREFTVDDLDAIKGIILTIECDGAFIAYLNGIEVIRSKVKMNEELDISGFIHELIPGINVFGIHGFNDKIDSNDFTFIPTLKFAGE